MMHKLAMINTIACLIVAVTCSTCLASQEKYIIGVEKVSYLPYYSGEDNQYKGFVRDILDSFAKKYNYHFLYRPLPIKRLHRDFLIGKTDFLYPDNPDWIPTQKKEHMIIYSKPVVTVIDGVMVLPQHNGRTITSLKQLGTIRGYTAPAYEGFLQAKQMTLVENNNFSGALKMVILKRTDGAYVSINPALYQLREVMNQPKALIFDHTLPYDYAEHLLSTIKHPKMIKLFNDFLSSENALINKLKIKYDIVENPTHIKE